MSRASTARAGAATPKAGPKPANGYFGKSELPLISLVFLLPFLAMYEVAFQQGYLPSDIIAFRWMQNFFHFFGASGRHLPALAVAGILLTWHIARKDTWHINPKYLMGMMLESALLAGPLILIGRVAWLYFPMMATGKTVPGWVVLSVGAGIYEELVFRLIAFTLLSLLFIDVLKLKKFWAYLLMVVVSSLAFSLYHYLGYEQFQLRSFVFRTVAGLYFGAVFAFRGFGISAGTHASYDILIRLLAGV